MTKNTPENLVVSALKIWPVWLKGKQINMAVEVMIEKSGLAFSSNSNI